VASSWAGSSSSLSSAESPSSSTPSAMETSPASSSSPSLSCLTRTAAAGSWGGALSGWRFAMSADWMGSCSLRLPGAFSGSTGVAPWGTASLMRFGSFWGFAEPARFGESIVVRCHWPPNSSQPSPDAAAKHAHTRFSSPHADRDPRRRPHWAPGGPCPLPPLPGRAAPAPRTRQPARRLGPVAPPRPGAPRRRPADPPAERRRRARARTCCWLSAARHSPPTQIRALGIEDQLLVVPKSSPAAKARYVYVPPGQIPDFAGLRVVGPSLLKKFLWPILRAPLWYALYKNAPGGQDESVDSFMSRVLGDELATALGSALMHGIYAADSRQLSARAALPFWSSHDRKKFLQNPGSTFESDVLQPLPNVGRLNAKLDHASAYSFKNGIETLAQALQHHLEARSNVQIFRESPVLSLRMRKDHTINVRHSSFLPFPLETDATLSYHIAAPVALALPCPP
jgi:hypothetical protein